MKLLMHVCCAPCSVECIAALREEGVEPTLFWYNPNIHPAEEYKLRRDTLKSYAASIGAELSPPKPQPPLIGRLTDVIALSLSAS